MLDSDTASLESVAGFDAFSIESVAVAGSLLANDSKA